MDFQFFHSSPPHESWYEQILSPQFQVEENKATEWTYEENQLFENALAQFEPDSPAFYKKVASTVPWKTTEQIRSHYQALVEDLELIESGDLPIPEYQTHVDDQEKQPTNMQEVTYKKNEGSQSNRDQAKKTINGQQRKRGVPWTEEEHQLFLMGMNRYGKGDWRSISRYYVLTRTPTQVASHAQKFFRRQTSSTPMERRRPSIHDVQIMNPVPNSFANASQSAPWNVYSSYLPNIVDRSILFNSDSSHMISKLNYK